MNYGIHLQVEKMGVLSMLQEYFDNVLVSAVFGGTLKVVLDYWRENRFALLVTDEIVREYAEKSAS